MWDAIDMIVPWLAFSLSCLDRFYKVDIHAAWEGQLRGPKPRLLFPGRAGLQDDQLNRVSERDVEQGAD
jgi:hypothetical protein